ncbi:hypothetical protein F5883DRAFT_441071 [Diaporthe sp. PMI_573]|nr:hypothetical protein F5883DRAFT_441071 [Diaporthaceae sp. PMI_573]
MELFFNISDAELLHQVHGEFPHELDRLKRAYSISDTNTIRPSTPSPSQILYGTQYEEVNRTLVGVLSLRWIYSGQYKTFTGTQTDPVVLTRSSFNWIRDIFTKGLETPMDLYALLTYIVVNDLGKDPQLASDYRSKTGEDISPLNHDIILLKALEAGLVLCVDHLPPAHKANVTRSMGLGAEFNVGQLAQAENAPACLASLQDMRGQERVFDFHFMQQLLDISGAAGHEDWTCAKKFIQPIFEAYRNVYEVAIGIILGEQGLREGYDVILTRRGGMLNEMGFRALDVRSPEDRALMRLLCMGGVANPETAELYRSVWGALDDRTKSSLVHSLNADGSIAEPAVQPTYMPAMLAQGVGEASSLWRDKARRLQSILQYLARVMSLTDEPNGRVIVVERSVLWVVKDVVQSRAFQQDPGILERTKVPESAVAKSA